MDSVTRIMTSLDHKTPDRVGLFESFWPEFEAICREQLACPADQTLEQFFGIDIVIACPDETIYPSKRREIYEDAHEIRYVNGWGMTVRQRKGAYFEEELEPAFEDAGGFARSDTFEDPLNEARYSYFDSFAERAKNEGMCVFGKIGGLYIRSAFICGTENILYQIAADPGFVTALAEQLEVQQTQIALEELRRADLYSTGIWIYDDIASNLAPVLSPKAFERIYYPCYKRLITRLKHAGATRVLLHCDGNVAPLLDAFIDAGVDGINPVEPKGGMSIPVLMKKYGTKLSFVGGMCNSFTLVNGDREHIESEARAILECARDGGVVIGSHSIGPDIPIENYLHYLKIVERYGNFR